MTNKERLLVAALAEGAAIEEAAKAAGYNLAYARQKAGEAAILAAVEAARAPKVKRKRKPGKLDIAGELKSIILDPTCDVAIKLTAMRVLISWLKGEPPEPMPAPVIIDDILEGQISANEDGTLRLPEGPAACDPAAEPAGEAEQAAAGGAGSAEAVHEVGRV